MSATGSARAGIPVVIAGGGMAGLAAAYELHRQHVPFVLLEAAGRAGGVVLSEQTDGFTVDAGPDALLVQKPEGIRLCEELGLGDRLVPTKPPRLAFVQRGGRLYAFPAASVLGIPTRWGPFVSTPLFSWAGKARMAGELFVAPRRDAGDESIGAFMTRRFGAEAAAYLAEPLLAGIHAGDVNRLSIRALFPRLVEAEEKHGSVLRAFRRRAARMGPSEGAFRSLPGGLSELVRALVAALPPGALRLNTPVRGVRQAAGGFEIETGAGERIAAAALVLATPGFVTATLLRDVAPAVSRLCDEIRYTSVATVALGFERRDVQHALNGSGFVVPQIESRGIMAGSWLSSKWPHRAPADRVLLRAFLGGARDPSALERADAELVEISHRAMAPLLGITGQPVLARVYRWERANAQHEVGHLERLKRLDAALAGHPGIALTGSAYRGVGIPDVVADGRAIGRQVSSWLAPPVSVSR